MTTLHSMLRRMGRIGGVWVYGARVGRRMVLRSVRRKGKKKVSRSSRVSYLTYKEQARELVRQKIEYWNTFYGFKIGKIYIKNQKTRWGSCSSRGNMNFNYRIVLLPAHLADYIIVHELCHLGEFNHSKKFWDLVGQTIPDYSFAVDELKRLHMNMYTR